ncbi:sulfatase-like hydrolase/transferase [Ornithinimicrobium sp. Arc0846-15]|nr:sulfatase-like hydrolase/transferase [Ornithinimicrobium laminariae]
MNLNGVTQSIDGMFDQIDQIGQIGRPASEPHYSMGWAWSGNAPFQWVKQVASHLGGSRNPMVVSWPKIKGGGEVRSQFTHLIDILPTILDAAGIPAHEEVNGITQKALDGVRITSTFNNSAAKPVRERQYFEVLSNRAIYDQGWIACAQHTLPWRQDYAPGIWDKDKWELYHLDEDFSESNDLAEAHPEKLEELKKLFDEEAEKYGSIHSMTAVPPGSRCPSPRPVVLTRTVRSSRTTPTLFDFPKRPHRILRIALT